MNLYHDKWDPKNTGSGSAQTKRNVQLTSLLPEELSKNMSDEIALAPCSFSFMSELISGCSVSGRFGLERPIALNGGRKQRFGQTQQNFSRNKMLVCSVQFNNPAV